MIETLTQENVLGRISKKASVYFDNEPDSAEMSFEDDEVDDEQDFQKFVK